MIYCLAQYSQLHVYMYVLYSTYVTVRMCTIDLQDQTVNLGVWHRQVQSRLKAIPDSVDKYHAALSAIGQLQVMYK